MKNKFKLFPASLPNAITVISLNLLMIFEVGLFDKIFQPLN